MLILPNTIMPLVLPFRPIIHKSTSLKALALLVGAILSPRKPDGDGSIASDGLESDRVDLLAANIKEVMQIDPTVNWRT